MSDEAHRVFTAIVHLGDLSEEKAEELQRDIQIAIYDLLDEADIDYKSILLKVVNGDKAVQDYEEESGKSLDDLFVGNEIGGFRGGDPDTSRKGALDVYPRSGKHKHKILLAIARSGDQGMTYEEVESETGIKNAHKRISELQQGGWLRSAGERLATKTGSMSNIWVITERAEHFIETKEKAGVLR